MYMYKNIEGDRERERAKAKLQVGARGSVHDTPLCLGSLRRKPSQFIIHAIINWPSI